jgi:hypothetical protein
MSHVGFEPTIPAFERAKMVHASDHAAIVIGYFSMLFLRNSSPGTYTSVDKTKGYVASVKGKVISVQAVEALRVAGD